jgi:predicted ATP-grasp superfamily ATP-dependent carboligase
MSAGLRAKSLVERILAFSRSGVGERVPVNVQSVVLEALDAVVASLPDGEWLVQPYLEGTLYGVGGVAWAGDVVCSVHQIAHRISPPDCGGTAYGETVAPDRALDGTVARFVAEVGWSGIFQVQFIRTRAADYLIDFNPRIYGTLGLAVAAGLNLPAVWAQRLLGHAPAFDGYAAGVRFRSEEKEGLAALTAIRRGDWRTVASVLTPRRRTTHAAFAAADPFPLLTSLVKVRKARDVLRTLDREDVHEPA